MYAGTRQTEGNFVASGTIRSSCKRRTDLLQKEVGSLQLYSLWWSEKWTLFPVWRDWVKRGAIEIASALLRFFETLPDNVTHVSTISDTCGGHNRNRFIVAAMLYAVQKLHISMVDIKYMESGHSYLEADVIYATIEHARKHQSIYTPKEWEILIRSCRRKPKPYSVTTMKHIDFVLLIRILYYWCKTAGKTDIWLIFLKS